MIMTIEVKRQIPGVGFIEICTFPAEVNDLSRDLSWLIGIFDANEYEKNGSEFNFPYPKITLEKQISGCSFKDKWVIMLIPTVEQSEIASYINSTLLRFK